MRGLLSLLTPQYPHSLPLNFLFVPRTRFLEDPIPPIPHPPTPLPKGAGKTAIISPAPDVQLFGINEFRRVVRRMTENVERKKGEGFGEKGLRGSSP